GRRFVLVTTLMVMGATTALIGALPTYAAAGVLSPTLLVALRFVQGAALGGTRRSAPPRPQCFVGADGPVARHVDGDRIYRDRHVAAAGGKLSCVGLAAAVLRERRAGRVRSVDPRRRGGNAAVPATRTRQVA